MLRALACRDFRLLWMGQALSTLGDRIVIVVLALYVNDIGTPTDVGIVLAAGIVPFIALLLFGGVWADRLPRHRVMVVTDVVRGGLHAALALLIVGAPPPIWVIAVIEALYGAAHAFFRPAYTGLVPQTIPPELVQEAQGATWLTYNVSGFVGPALASALFLTLGAAAAFAVDAASFFVGAVLLAMIHPREETGRAPRQPMLAELAGGWREVRARPWALLTIGGLAFFLLLAHGPYQALGPAIAELEYDEAAVYGLLGAFGGGGAILGSLAASRWRPRRPLLVSSLLELGAIGGFMCFAAGLSLFVVAPFMVLGGFATGVWLVWWETALATQIPPEALSRVSSFDWMGAMGLLPIGYLIAGPLGESFGVQETLFAGAVLGAVLQIGLACSRPIREFRPNRVD